MLILVLTAPITLARSVVDTAVPISSTAGGTSAGEDAHADRHLVTRSTGCKSIAVVATIDVCVLNTHIS